MDFQIFFVATLVLASFAFAAFSLMPRAARMALLRALLRLPLPVPVVRWMGTKAAAASGCGGCAGCDRTGAAPSQHASGAPPAPAKIVFMRRREN